MSADLGIVAKIIAQQVNLAKDALRQNPEHSEFGLSIHEQFLSTWFPTLYTIQMHNIPSTDPRYVAWVKIGANVGLHEANEKIRWCQWMIERLIPPFTRTCFWKGCLCSQMPAKPKHSLKSCTGCRRVFYCGTQCQTNDWSAHRLECRI
ncbi:hypothetical protein K474DRAFT_1664945 [Panus rudis PR-1116 ss-1]|nr:hypothetical protein K474DRAFT_1664945 [Panus rudis PR-1116 ss-1]